MKFTDDFRDFLKDDVNLNQTRLDTLNARVVTIREFLSTTLPDDLLEMIPSGSWAHRTIIRPVTDADGFDADILVKLKHQPERTPSDYIEILYAALRGSNTYREMVTRKTRCVRVNYAGEFHMDLVPHVEFEGVGWIVNRLEPDTNGRFERSNPERFTSWLADKQADSNSHFVPTIRLLKYLRDYKNTFTAKSIILTTLCGNQVGSSLGRFYEDVPTTFVLLLEAVAAKLPVAMPSILDPAGSGDDFASRYKDEWNYENFRKMISSYAAKARAALDSTDRTESILLWRAIFGDGFKRTVKLAKADATQLEESLSASIPTASEQHIENRFVVEINPLYRTRIVARCLGFSNGTRFRRAGFREYDLATHGNLVEKNREISFTVSTTVPAPYEIFWKVRNGGVEARASGQLRGEIVHGDHKTETTSYKGSHFVECYVVKDNKVVSHHRQPVIVV